MKRVPLGNPLESEVSAFRWLIVVMVAGVTVVIVAKVISAQAGIVYGTALLFFVGFLVIRGVLQLIRDPEELDEEYDPNYDVNSGKSDDE
jgi:hypothetical protein